MEELSFTNLKKSYEKIVEEILEDLKLGAKMIKNKTMSIDEFIIVVNKELLPKTKKLEEQINFLNELGLLNSSERFKLICVVSKIEQEVNKIKKIPNPNC